jgi:glucose-1-phosphate thymidylyltransferase
VKLIIPLAGYGTRLRPHTYSQPKPLLHVAGKAVLGYIIDQLAALEVEEIIFVVSGRANQIEDYMRAYYPQYQIRCVEQTEMLGQSFGIYAARPYIDQGEVLIIFSDTVFKTDLASLPAVQADGVLHLREVPDPARFGVAVLDQDGFVSRLVEKPATPVSNLAIVGVYYFKEAKRLFSAIEKQLTGGQQLKGEYFLADAITIMLGEGARFQARSLELWEDCGTIPALLAANRHLLTAQAQAQASVAQTAPEPALPDGYTVIPPVYIAPDARITRSVIGPYATIGAGVHISDCVISDSIIHEQSRLEASLLTGSVIGRKVVVRGRYQRLNIGDDCQLEADAPAPGYLTGN